MSEDKAFARRAEFQKRFLQIKKNYLPIYSFRSQFMFGVKNLEYMMKLKNYLYL